MSHYFGPIMPKERIQQRKVHGFECSDFRQPAKFSIPKHAHPSPILLFVLGGSVVESYDTHSFEYVPAMIALRPAGEMHQHHYGNTGARCLAVAIQKEVLEENVEVRRLSNNLMHVRDALLFGYGLKILRQIQNSESVASTAIEELLYRTFASLSGLKRKETAKLPPPWLRQARDLIHDCFLEELSLSQIANSVGVHPIYLADCFRKYYASSIGRMIRKLRLNYAMDELTKKERPLTELALNAGFFDHSHFTNFIKQQTGMSPSELRKIIQQK